MADPVYSIPAGVHAIPRGNLDLRLDAEIDRDLLNPRPVSDEKNVWFFWHSGYASMHPYTQRNVRAWHRRFSKQGWAIRVMDLVPGSPLNIAQFLDVTDPQTFPKAFIEGKLGGKFAAQHSSDLVRFPLILKYGGVYADVGMLQIGDLDAMWHKTVGDPTSPWDVLSYCTGDANGLCLANYFLVAGRKNPLFQRCHRLFLALWAADGGRTDTVGMHRSPLLEGCPLLGPTPEYEDDGRIVSSEEGGRILTDYIIQAQACTMVMGLVDKSDNWNGPKYCEEHVYTIEFMVGSQLINEMTTWNGKEAFRLMSLPLPSKGSAETDDQRKARQIVEACLQKSFGFKLATGLILKVLGPTLSSLWREHAGSDDVPGTYAHWLRYGLIYWCQDELPPRVDLSGIAPLREGKLLG